MWAWGPGCVCFVWACGLDLPDLFALSGPGGLDLLDLSGLSGSAAWICLIFLVCLGLDWPVLSDLSGLPGLVQEVYLGPPVHPLNASLRTLLKALQTLQNEPSFCAPAGILLGEPLRAAKAQCVCVCVCVCVLRACLCDLANF